MPDLLQECNSERKKSYFPGSKSGLCMRLYSAYGPITVNDDDDDYDDDAWTVILANHHIPIPIYCTFHTFTEHAALKTTVIMNISNLFIPWSYFLTSIGFA